jgi:ABC-type phosphate transport system auxiliary subunit
MLALLEAWVCGDAPWLFVNGQNVAVSAWLSGGNLAVIDLAKSAGITPKSHPPKAPLKL